MTSRGGQLQIVGLDTYMGGAHILQDIAFTLDAGSTAILGRNGMGKTTLCSAVMGLLRSRRGKILFNGRDISQFQPNKRARAGLGYVPQGRRVFPSLTVHEHFTMVARAYRGTAGRWLPQDVYDLFPQLHERRANKGNQLSGGEQQMLAIGRALLTQPRLLILDEPSEGLAPVVVRELVSALKTLEQEGVTILLVEQNLKVAAAVTERLVVMVTGRIVDDMPSQALLGNRELQRQYLGLGATRGTDLSRSGQVPTTGTGKDEDTLRANNYRLGGG